MKYKEKDLESKTREELYEIAKEEEIPHKSKMNKEELIDALSGKGGHEKQKESHHKEKKDPSQPGQGGGQGDTPAPKGAKPEDYKNIPGNQS
jgi:hypothetical protein